MHCPTCKASDIGEIRFSSISTGVDFRYCRRCENRWWTTQSGPVDLRAVLEQAPPAAKAS